MLLQMRQLGELALANFASVRFDAQMDPRVLGEVRRVGEGFVALGALVGFRFSHVNLGVQLEVRLRTENLKKKIIMCEICKTLLFI